MKDATRESPRSSHSSRSRASLDGRRGIAVSPRRYGVDFIDRRPHRANHTGLPDALKDGIESLAGRSMDDVRVHFNSTRPARVGALAYTESPDIHLGPGQEAQLPHEAWHVVQQKEGRVRPLKPGPQGVSINDDGDLEREADRMGAQARMSPTVASASADRPFAAAERHRPSEGGRDLAPVSRSPSRSMARSGVIQMRRVLLPGGDVLITERYSSAHLVKLAQAFLARGEDAVAIAINAAIANGEYKENQLSQPLMKPFPRRDPEPSPPFQIKQPLSMTGAEPETLASEPSDTVSLGQPQPEPPIPAPTLPPKIGQEDPSGSGSQLPPEGPQPKESPPPSKFKPGLFKLIASTVTSGLLSYQTALINSVLKDATHPVGPQGSSSKKAPLSISKFRTLGFAKIPPGFGLNSDLFDKHFAKNMRRAVRSPWHILGASLALSGASYGLKKTIDAPKVRDLLQDARDEQRHKKASP